MKARYNVVATETALIIMQKVLVDQTKMTPTDWVRFHELVELETQNVQDAVPGYALPKGVE